MVWQQVRHTLQFAAPRHLAYVSKLVLGAVTKWAYLNFWDSLLRLGKTAIFGKGSGQQLFTARTRDAYYRTPFSKGQLFSIQLRTFFFSKGQFFSEGQFFSKGQFFSDGQFFSEEYFSVKDNFSAKDNFSVTDNFSVEDNFSVKNIFQ